MQGGFIIITFKRPVKKEKAQVRPSTAQVQTLIEMMAAEYMTMAELADICRVKRIRTFRESYVTPALKDGAIERKYQLQPNHPSSNTD